MVNLLVCYRSPGDCGEGVNTATGITDCVCQDAEGNTVGCREERDESRERLGWHPVKCPDLPGPR